MPGHERWLEFSKDVLRSARGLLKLEIYSTCVYHCQQCAEKSLKAYLVFKGERIVKTHDLVFLVNLCRKFDIAFDRIKKDAKAIKPFATEFRYPSEHEIPDYDEAAVAVNQATKIFKFILKKISEPISPQMNIFGL